MCCEFIYWKWIWKPNEGSDSRNSISTINAETANILGLKIELINAKISGINCGNHFIKN